MYNEERKLQYLKESVNRYESIEYTVTTYFKATENMETILDKDISQFTLNEIISLYKSFCTPSEWYIRTINSQLSQYTTWCQKQNILTDNQNHFAEIDTNLIYQCLNTTLIEMQYITREQLYNIVNSGQINNISDCFLLLSCFEGICGKEYTDILNIRPKDIKGNMVTLHSGKTLEVDSKFVSVALQSAGQYTFYLGLLGDKERQFDLSDDRCFKRYRRDITAENEVFVVIKRFNKLKQLFNSPALSSKALMESGRIDFIKKLMKKHNCGLNECLKNEDIYKLIADRYGRLQSFSSYILKFGKYYE